jgi:hypothetical protein
VNMSQKEKIQRKKRKKCSVFVCWVRNWKMYNDNCSAKQETRTCTSETNRTSTFKYKPNHTISNYNLVRKTIK